MLKRIRINLSYDGGGFFGWQVQPDVVTVQETIERALTEIYGGSTIRIFASGRTDRGVHAIDQVIHFRQPLERSPEVLYTALNAILPSSIHVWRVKEVDNHFHARFKAYERTYGYRILKNGSPFQQRYGWQSQEGFDPEKAEVISKLFEGTFNFRRFATKPESDVNPVCTVKKTTWQAIPDGWLFTITSDRFLRRMVRTIVGTIEEAASDQLEVDDILRALETQDADVGAPAPPQGLALLRVRYEEDDQDDIPPESPWSITDEIVH